MVQKSLAASVVKSIFLRILLVFAALVIGGFFFPITIENFVTHTLGYHNPPGFLDMPSWADWSLSWDMASIFWAGILYGTLGKKIDYIFITGLFILCSLDFFFTENMTPLVYSGLVGATVLGVVIGYIINIARKRLFPTSWIGR
ncbi:MAG TPA: hypothetical protein VG934_01100 [Candidatus Paceibacterota bacterium]|nr:hypothetical protein [Candidatus Paceibacterota bacterium]